MLQALICKKHQRPNEEGVSVCLKEDTLTACVFERLRYLPEQYLKDVFCVIAGSNKEVWTPETLGNLKNVKFWHRFALPDGRNAEPDVLFEFENLLLIVEAKRWDNAQQQYISQWEKEMVSILHSHTNSGKKALKLLAVGGNRNQLFYNDVWSTTWADFVKKIKMCCSQAEQHVHILVESIVNSLQIHGIEMRDPVYLDKFATELTQINMDNVQSYLSKMTSSKATSLTTFSATLNVHFRMDIKSIFAGVYHG